MKRVTKSTFPGNSHIFLILAVAAQRQNARGPSRGSDARRFANFDIAARPRLAYRVSGRTSMSDATVLFADVSGSTRLIETAGDAVALKAIARCIERLRKAAEVTGGRVVKNIGDEVMVLFATPEAAVKVAAKMHATIAALPAVGDTKLGVHVGFHSGPVIQVEKDVLGETVKLASKLVEQAHKGQTSTSQQTAALLSPALKPYSRELRELAVREQGDGVWLCEIVAQAT